LARHRGSERVDGPAELDEERVALSIQLAAARGRERLPQQSPVLGEDRGVAVFQPSEEGRRAFDVGEQEGASAAALVGHPG
jgi:hypothetical protein